MKFYRIEHRIDKSGVYRNDYKEVMNTMNDLVKLNKHPSPWLDSALEAMMKSMDWEYWWIDPDFIFGFKSEEQMRAWFYRNEMFEVLIKNDFVLNIYEGEIMAGSTQAIADKTQLKFVETVELSKFIA